MPTTTTWARFFFYSRRARHLRFRMDNGQASLKVHAIFGATRPTINLFPRLRSLHFGYAFFFPGFSPALILPWISTDLSHFRVFYSSQEDLPNRPWKTFSTY